MAGRAMLIEAMPSAALRHYQSLDRASQDMLEAARAGDWNRVCRLEGACAVLIAGLRQLGGAAALEPREQHERVRILQRLIRRDEQIRSLCAAEEQIDTLSTAKRSGRGAAAWLH